MSDWRVLGVDACKAGWIGIAMSQDALSGYFEAEIGDLAEKASEGGPLAVVAIDIPIGLPDTGRRRADMLAREAAGPRRASVFMTPVRPALEADDYESASAASLKLAGEGISRQAFALQAKILQVDKWVCQARHRVVEVHVGCADLRTDLSDLRGAWDGSVLTWATPLPRSRRPAMTSGR
jgi:predicted RNase H-like nuclease